MNRFFLFSAAVLLISGVMLPIFAEPAEELKKVPAADLKAEADEQLQTIEGWMKADEYKDRKDDIRRAAGVLAVMGQALKEHPQGNLPKFSALGLRDAGVELAESQYQEAAKKALSNLKAAVTEGIPNMQEQPPVAWKDVISMDDMMHIINTRNSQLRRAARRSRDPEGDSRHAITIAMLSIAMADQAEDYLSEEAEIKAWKKYAHDFQSGMTELAAAFKAKDKAGIQKHLDFATKACNDCHAQFRDNE